MKDMFATISDLRHLVFSRVCRIVILASVSLAFGLQTALVVQCAEFSVKEVRNVLSKSASKIDHYIYLDGRIESGDLVKFNSAVRDVFSLIKKEQDFSSDAPIHDVNEDNWIKLVLNSDGGDVRESMAIGRRVRELMGETNVYGTLVLLRSAPSSKKEFDQQLEWPDFFPAMVDNAQEGPPLYKHCYSACILILVAGVQRFAASNIDETGWNAEDATGEKKIVPTLGLHRPYFAKEEFAKLTVKDAAQQFHDLEQDVSKYLVEMGASQYMIDRMMATNSESIDLVEDDDIKKLFPWRDPFYEEWIIAKCQGYELSAEDKATWEWFNKEWSKTRGEVPIENFIPKGMTADEAKSILQKEGIRNTGMQGCEFRTRTAQQESILSAN
ncbi:hypothetical protein DK847_09125 [Aestuariivirga litoralis]|uniref:Uncharacterized protein n=1 Tax=Aestuariivirga litoralis TaxID=2650924 RepID=A0A2W2BBF4_9HYPH|nr:hypothetical protein [Aestuariivirga litoralis]PZF77468.1 hypothetical protein DK847_09125 [Aestuariivirga litoralis]